MQNNLELRLDNIIARRQAEMLSMSPATDSEGLARRIGHMRIVAELPRLSAKIASAVAILNDRLSDVDLWLKVDLVHHTPAAEALYTISLASLSDQPPSLTITVDGSGRLRGLLRNGQTTSLVGSSTVFSADASFVMEMLVRLLETHYG
jgi:hypothetical protein